MKIKVVQDLCIGAASCVAIAPNTFKLDDQNKAQVTNPTGDDDDTQLAAAKSCPVNAIVIEDENGKKIWPPEQ